MFQKNIYFSLLFFIFICGLIYICFTPTKRQCNLNSKQIQFSRYIPSKPRVELTGFQYDLNFEGEKSLELKADRFSIRKKKLGLIRFGMAQEAFFENAEVSFFNKKNFTAPRDSASARNLSLLSLDKVLTSSEAKRLSSLVMAPISIIFHDENNKISRIQANSASIRPQRKEVVLTGDVRMTSEEKYITTNMLIFLPEKDEVHIPGDYLLEIQGKKKTGGRVSSDIFLNSITL